MEIIRTPHIHEKSSEITIMMKKTNLRLSKIVSALILILSVFICNGQTTDYFTVLQHEVFNIGQGTLIDFNNDGYLDFIGTHAVEEWTCNFRALKNNGNGTFTDATIEVFGSDTISIINPGNQLLVEDFNGDGLDDLFIGAMGIDAEPWGGDQNRLFSQTSDGKMEDNSIRLPQRLTYTHAESCGDIDNDGDIDIFIVESFSDEWVGLDGFYINNGQGYFTYDSTRIPSEILPHAGAIAFKLADSDLDNDLDLFMGVGSNPEDGDQAVPWNMLLLNNGEGQFSFANSNTFPEINDLDQTVNQPEMIFSDFNNDGLRDLLQINLCESCYPQLRIGLFFQNSNKKFRDGSYMFEELSEIDFPRISDFNNDGFIDIIAAYKDGGFKLLLNQEGVRFIDASQIIPLEFEWFVDAYPGDFDNDADVDILITKGDEFYVLKNEMPYDLQEKHPLQIPDIPILSSPENNATVSENTTLTWQADSLTARCNLQVSKTQSFENCFIDSTLTSSFIEISNLTEGQKLIWRINAENSSGTSNWSGTWSFTYINQPPTSISLSPAIIEENSKSGLTVGYLTTNDPDINDNHTYSLVTGNGVNDENNEMFKIIGDTLVLDMDLTLSDTSDLKIYIQSKDDYGNTIDQAIVVNVVPSCLVAFYPFNGNANDESSNDNNGIVNGAVLTTDRNNATDRAYRFDGINDNIELGRGSNLINDAESFTITSWIYPYEQSDDTQFTILSERLEGENYQFAVTDNDLYFSYWDDGQEYAIETQKDLIVHDMWQFIAVTYGNDTLRFYVDGELNFEQNISINIDNHNSTLFIGSYNGTEALFNGKLDDISVYNCCLTKEKINLLMAQTIITSSNSLIASEKSFKIFPNPTNGFINIEFDSFSRAKTLLEIFNIHGQRIYMEEYYPISTIKRIELSTLSKGVYFFKISNSMRQQVEKIIIDK